MALMRHLEAGGARVLNGSTAFTLELSKSAQAGLMRRLGIAFPRSVVFNDVAALRARAADFRLPALVKPEQGGSGARIYLVNVRRGRALLRDQPALWLPDNLLLVQEYFPVDPARGIVRMEFLGGELLYAMRVVSPRRGSTSARRAVCNPGEATPR